MSEYGRSCDNHMLGIVLIWNAISPTCSAVYNVSGHPVHSQPWQAVQTEDATHCHQEPAHWGARLHVCTCVYWVIWGGVQLHLILYLMVAIDSHCNKQNYHIAKCICYSFLTVVILIQQLVCYGCVSGWCRICTMALNCVGVGSCYPRNFPLILPLYLSVHVFCAWQMIVLSITQRHLKALITGIVNALKSVHG